MIIQVQAGNEQIATYEFLFTSLQEAVLNMNLEDPIKLDRFLIRNSAFPTHVIPEARGGDTLKLKLIFEDYEKEKYAPILKYCTGTNLTKSTNKINWNNYFDFEGVPEPLENDEIKVYPKKVGELKYESCITVRQDMNNSPSIIYIAYGAVISLKMEKNEAGEKQEFYFRMDPLVKVSSNQGG